MDIIRMKQYNELNRVEKHIIKEYKDWVKCEEHDIAISQADYWRGRARELEIEHLL